MKSILDFMTTDQIAAYDCAASLSAANEPDRLAWLSGVSALNCAKLKAIDTWLEDVPLNRHGQPFGGIHPAVKKLTGIYDLSGCYAPAK